MSKAILYAANTGTQATTVLASLVNFGSSIRKYGGTYLAGDAAIVPSPGYYSVDVNLTVNGTAAGTLLIQVLSNGTAVPGAEATVTLEADSATTVEIPCVVRYTCPCNPGNITVQTSGAVSAITNAAIRVERE